MQEITVSLPLETSLLYIHSWNKIDAIFLSSCIKLLKLTFRALALLPLPWYKRKLCWQRWDSNPRHRNDWCLKPAPQTTRPRYHSRVTSGRHFRIKNNLTKILSLFFFLLQSVDKVLMAVREEPLLEFHCKQMDHFVGLHFSNNFHFALMIHLVKGMELFHQLQLIYLVGCFDLLWCRQGGSFYIYQDK